MKSTLEIEGTIVLNFPWKLHKVVRVETDSDQITISNVSITLKESDDCDYRVDDQPTACKNLTCEQGWVVSFEVDKVCDITTDYTTHFSAVDLLGWSDRNPIDLQSSFTMEQSNVCANLLQDETKPNIEIMNSESDYETPFGGTRHVIDEIIYIRTDIASPILTIAAIEMIEMSIAILGVSTTVYKDGDIVVGGSAGKMASDINLAVSNHDILNR
eukprot:UN24234